MAKGTRAIIRLEKLFDRDVPWSFEAERALLGSLILEPQRVDEVSPILVAGGETFYSTINATLYDAISGVWERSNNLDTVLLLEALKPMPPPRDSGGWAELIVSIAQAVPSSANAAAYAGVVANKHRLRKVIESAGQAIHSCYEIGNAGDNAEVDTTIEKIESDMFVATSRTAASEPVASAAQSVQEIFDEIDRLTDPNSEALYLGVPSGFPDLDELTQGFQPGELSVIAARPSMGKSALMANIAVNMAKAGIPSLIFSIEQRRTDLMRRILCSEAGVDFLRTKSRHISKPEIERLMSAAGVVNQMPLYCDDTSSIGVGDLRARVRRYIQKFKIKAVFIDYIQLVNPPATAVENRQVGVSAVVRGVKSLAKELSIPIIALAQINRTAESREDKRPRLSELRESGALEQEGDLIAFIHREEYYHIGDEQWMREHPEEIGVADIIVAKQRNGPVGLRKLAWRGDLMRFETRSDPFGARAPTPQRNGQPEENGLY